MLLVVGLAAAPFTVLGPLSLHMAAHIVLMNCAAPLLASAWIIWRRPEAAGASRALWLAVFLQLLLLWAWHAPAAQRLADHGLPMFAMHASLFAAALWFWHSLIRLVGNARWHGVAALMVTGKLACLLAALFVFAPAALYAGGHHGTEVTLADQQLAGLLMITACPLSYVLAGIVLAAQILNDASETRRPARRAVIR
jgi:putative membrane protein